MQSQTTADNVCKSHNLCTDYWFCFQDQTTTEANAETAAKQKDTRWVLAKLTHLLAEAWRPVRGWFMANPELRFSGQLEAHEVPVPRSSAAARMVAELHQLRLNLVFL